MCVCVHLWASVRVCLHVTLSVYIFTSLCVCLCVCPCVCLSTFATSNAEKEEADLELPGVPDHQPQEGKEKKKERVALEAS